MRLKSVGRTAGALLRVALLSTVTACATHAGSGGPAPSGRESAAGPAGLRVGWTDAACFAGAGAGDADGDGVADGCEHALAAAFAPVLVFDERECGWDSGTGRVAGGYLYAAQRIPATAGARIAYLPAYARDCGWDLPACRVTWWLCEGHPGDSEVVVLDVGYDAAAERWSTQRVFLSAHCHGRSAGRCRWFGGRELERFGWADGAARGAPVVWVASGKHGGYPSREACGGGHWGYDGCGRNRAARRFPVVSPRQNAGSRARPFPAGVGRDCVRAAELPWPLPGADPARAECFWSVEGEFRGWQRPGGGAGATAYGRYLAGVAGF